MTLYTNEVISYLLSRRINGLKIGVKDPVLKVQILDLFIRDYIPLNSNLKDRDYITLLLSKYIKDPASLKTNFDDIMFKQLESYITDMYSQLALTVIPARILREIIVGVFPSDIRNQIIPMLKVFDESSNIGSVRTIANVITLTPEFFKEDKVISITQF